MLNKLDEKWTVGVALSFHDDGPIAKGSPTRKFSVHDKRRGSQIGFVKWFAPWRQYVFYPMNTGLLPVMMEDAIEFCRTKTQQQRDKN